MITEINGIIHLNNFDASRTVQFDTKKIILFQKLYRDFVIDSVDPLFRVL